MNQEPKKHLSPVIVWSIIVLAAACTGFATWKYWNEIDTIYSKINSGTILLFKETPNNVISTEEPESDWKMYTSNKYRYSIQYPPTLTYKETDEGKILKFQSAEDIAAEADCQNREATECIDSRQIIIEVDANLNSSNADDLTSSIEEISGKRVQKMNWAENPKPITISNLPGYEGISIGMFESYNIISKNNNHLYDLSLLCSATQPSLDHCKDSLTEDQIRMIESFKFN